MPECYSIVYVCTSSLFLCHGHLGWFHVWAVVNSAAVNTGACVSFWSIVFSRYMPRSGIAGSFGSCIFSFLLNPGGGFWNDLYTIVTEPSGADCTTQAQGEDGSPFQSQEAGLGCSDRRHTHLSSSDSRGSFLAPDTCPPRVGCNLAPCDLLRSRLKEQRLSGALSVVWPVLAAVTEYIYWGLNQQMIIVHSSGGWEPGFGGAACLGSGKACLPGLRMTAFLLCPYIAKREIISVVFLFLFLVTWLVGS